MSRGQALSLFRKELERVLPKAEETGVRVLVEPEPDLLMERTAEIKPFVEDLRSPFLGVNFDIGHFFCAGEDPAQAFEELFPWVGHVHVEDIAETRVHRHLICGRGAIDFHSVFSTMARLGYRGHMSLELYPYTDRPEAAGRESLDHLTEIITEAKLPVEGY
jgi:sugar phosphate isomerase/epimerase